MHVTDKIKLPKEILELVEKTNEPMSLDDIVDKFDPGFPFKARRVTGDFEGHTFTIMGLMERVKGDIAPRSLCPKQWRESETTVNYESEECTHCLGLADNRFNWERHKKAWVLV
jgi:hypothetical protein